MNDIQSNKLENILGLLKIYHCILKNYNKKILNNYSPYFLIKIIIKVKNIPIKKNYRKNKILIKIN